MNVSLKERNKKLVGKSGNIFQFERFKFFFFFKKYHNLLVVRVSGTISSVACISEILKNRSIFSPLPRRTVQIIYYNWINLLYNIYYTLPQFYRHGFTRATHVISNTVFFFSFPLPLVPSAAISISNTAVARKTLSSLANYLTDQ